MGPATHRGAAGRLDRPYNRGAREEPDREPLKMETAIVNPTEVTERYFAAMRTRDIESLSALYADDATFTHPNGKEFSGVGAIREMHLGVFKAGAPAPTPIATVSGDNSIAVEIQVRLPDGTSRRTANFYHLTSSGLIQHLRVYMQTG